MSKSSGRKTTIQQLANDRQIRGHVQKMKPDFERPDAMVLEIHCFGEEKLQEPFLAVLRDSFKSDANMEVSPLSPEEINPKFQTWGRFMIAKSEDPSSSGNLSPNFPSSDRVSPRGSAPSHHRSASSSSRSSGFSQFSSGSASTCSEKTPSPQAFHSGPPLHPQNDRENRIWELELKNALLTQQVEYLNEEVEKEADRKTKLEREFRDEKARLEQKIEEERSKLEKKFEQKMEDERREFREEKSKLEQKMEEERSRLEKKFEQKMEEERSRLEKKFEQKMEDKRREFREEKSKLEKKIEKLQKD